MESQEERISKIRERCKALIKKATASGETRQEDIARALGIGENAFRQYATGRTAVPLSHLEPFCEYMGVSIEYVITGKENPILEAYNGLDDEDKLLANKVLGIKKPHAQKKHQAA